MLETTKDEENLILDLETINIFHIVVPGKVENLQFLNISDRALTVKWRPPREVNGILTFYQLKYTIKDKPDSLRVLNFTADTLSTKIEQLQVTHKLFSTYNLLTYKNLIN